MQEHLNYKVLEVINNWFDYAHNDFFDDAENGHNAQLVETFYCAWCAQRKNIKLMTHTYDAKNRKVCKCSSCASKITKGVKK